MRTLQEAFLWKYNNNKPFSQEDLLCALKYFPIKDEFSYGNTYETIVEVNEKLFSIKWENYETPYFYTGEVQEVWIK